VFLSKLCGGIPEALAVSCDCYYCRCSIIFLRQLAMFSSTCDPERNRIAGYIVTLSECSQVSVCEHPSWLTTWMKCTHFYRESSNFWLWHTATLSVASFVGISPVTVGYINSLWCFLVLSP